MRNKITFIVFLILLLSIPLSAYAQAPTSSTTFAWDYAEEAQADLGVEGGFRLYAGSESRNYNFIIGTALPGEREKTFNTTMLCGDKFFALVAFMPDDTPTGTESGYSNEVTQTYVPAPVTRLAYSVSGVFTWNLNTYDTDCTMIGYDLYLTKTSGSYSAYDIVASAGKGINNISIDTSIYRGRWYATVIPYTTGSDGRKIVGNVANELSLVFKPATPGNLRFTVPTP